MLCMCCRVLEDARLILAALVYGPPPRPLTIIGKRCHFSLPPTVRDVPAHSEWTRKVGGFLNCRRSCKKFENLYTRSRLLQNLSAFKPAGHPGLTSLALLSLKVDSVSRHSNPTQCCLHKGMRK